MKQQTQESVITVHVIDKLFPIITTLLFVTPVKKYANHFKFISQKLYKLKDYKSIKSSWNKYILLVFNFFMTAMPSTASIKKHHLVPFDIVKAGDHCDRNISRQMLPLLFMLGWYILVVKATWRKSFIVLKKIIQQLNRSCLSHNQEILI